MNGYVGPFLRTLMFSCLLLGACTREPVNTSPDACFTISPASGDTETRFVLDAGCTHDADDQDSLLVIRWDYENDGMWDYPFVRTRINIHQFEAPGIFTVRLQVRDPSGATGESVQTVEVVQGNKPPLRPFSPNPRDSASHIRFSGRLSWVGLDPDNPEILFDLYLGKERDPPLFATSLKTDEHYTHELIPGTKYFWKVTARDAGGLTSTGPVWNFSIHSGIYIRDTLTDLRDGHRYPVLKLGSQWWMATNLAYDYPEYSTVYGNDPVNLDGYGRLYSIYAKDTLVCPPGWTIPKDWDWALLEKYLGMAERAVSESGWRGIDQGAQLLPGGTSGMDIQLGGYMDSGGNFFSLGEKAYFRYQGSPGRMIMKDYDQIYRQTWSGQDFVNVYYFSVRCIRRY